ncbi:hypothetical protein LCGC14_2398180, partial [marine sediment metagenome]
MRKQCVVLAPLLLTVISCGHSQDTSTSTDEPRKPVQEAMATITENHPESEMWVKPDQREFSFGPEFTIECQQRI